MDVAGLVVKTNGAVGEDHRGVRERRAMVVLPAGLGLELVAQVPDPAERVVERQGPDHRAVRVEIGTDPVEERDFAAAAYARPGHPHGAGPYIGRDGSCERSGRVAHERESPGVAAPQAAVEPEAVL